MNMNEKPKRSSGKRNKKRKFTGNIYTRQESKDLNESASSKKILTKNTNFKYSTNEEFKKYNIIDLDVLFSNIENYLCCKICGGNITLKEEIICGLSSKIFVDCKNCSNLCNFRNSPMIGAKNNISDINRRLTYTMRAIGKGYASMKLFCGLMDLPKPISKKSYNASIKKLLGCSNVVAEKSMKNAALEEVKLTDSSNVIISGDGTWKTRGHSSRVGVCSVIGDKTGKVIDKEVLSSYCKSCDTWKTKKKTQEYNIWKKKHEEECLINHSGSAGKMEVTGMVRIFQRSQKKHNIKYVGYIGDGDAKTYQSICEVIPYGKETSISKIECVGHIQKRMGTRLRKLKQTGVKCNDGKPVGGKGRLTDKLIDLFTIYYGNAIRENKNNLLDMRKAVWAIYFHTRSSDSEPLHSFCPPGLNSWCRYQKSIAEGTVSNFTHKKEVPSCVMDIIKPIFNDLSHPKLLQRCLGGKTQNNNESFNSLIWKLCPKTQGVGRRIVDIATNEAVVLFNEGNIGRITLMEEFKLKVGPNAKECLTLMDNQRIATSQLRFLQSTKEARKLKRQQEKATNEDFLALEGDVYSAGAF